MGGADECKSIGPLAPFSRDCTVINSGRLRRPRPDCNSGHLGLHLTPSSPDVPAIATAPITSILRPPPLVVRPWSCLRLHRRPWTVVEQHSLFPRSLVPPLPAFPPNRGSPHPQPRSSKEIRILTSTRRPGCAAVRDYGERDVWRADASSDCGCEARC